MCAIDADVVGVADVFDVVDDVVTVEVVVMHSEVFELCCRPSRDFLLDRKKDFLDV